MGWGAWPRRGLWRPWPAIVAGALAAADPRGAPCAGLGAAGCREGLECRCLAENRGLHACMEANWPLPGYVARRGRKPVTLKSFAGHWQRRGLRCEPRLPPGAKPMRAPPVVLTDGRTISPLTASSSLIASRAHHAQSFRDEIGMAGGRRALEEWAQLPDGGRGYYTRYLAVGLPGVEGVGVPILAGSDVSAKRFSDHAATLRHFLQRALTRPNATIQALSRSSVRLLLGGSKKWTAHPEVARIFPTGLGGGAPWFPSTGIMSDESANTLFEELFHTVQYVVMSPRDVCRYHRAYAHAVAAGLYSTDGSGPEVDGEPVPTVQADEYLAMALQRWLGSTDGGPKEYLVPGNNHKGTGREHLRRKDLRGFCLIAKFFRSDDTWNPNPHREPWKSHRNQAMDPTDVREQCRPVLAELGAGCPSANIGWPMAARAA